MVCPEVALGLEVAGLGLGKRTGRSSLGTFDKAPSFPHPLLQPEGNRSCCLPEWALGLCVALKGRPCGAASVLEDLAWLGVEGVVLPLARALGLMLASRSTPVVRGDGAGVPSAQP